MRITTTQPIIGYDWDEVIDMNGETLTVRWAIRHALNTAIPDMPWDTPETMLRCGTLSRLVHENDVVDIPSRDLDYILERSGKPGMTPTQMLAPVHGPMVYMFLAGLFKEEQPALAAVPEADNG